MFKLHRSETFDHTIEVENHLQNVDSTLFLRTKSIDVNCYR